MRLAVALLLLATSVQAATWFTDGGCAVNGDGTTSACGVHGPFQTIGQAESHMVAGDTLIERGPHLPHTGCCPTASTHCSITTGFDGTYNETIWIGGPIARPSGIPFGVALPCTSGSPCMIRSAQAADGLPGNNGADERAVVMASQLRSGWTVASGSGANTIWTRTMEVPVDRGDEDTAHIRGQPASDATASADALADPYQLWTNDPAAVTIHADAPEGNVDLPYSVRMLQCTAAGTPFACCTGLAAGGTCGDGDAAPADGYWSYCTATSTGCTAGNIYVNPPGSDDPSLTVLVPFAFNALEMHSPTSWLTLQDMDLEMPRMIPGDIGQSGSTMDHLTFRRVHIKHYRQKGMIGHTNTHLLVEDCMFSYCGRGASWSSSTGDTCYGMRWFQSPGVQVTKTTPMGQPPLTFQYMGTGGTWRFSGGAPNASNGRLRATYLDAPWNTQTHTFAAWRGHAIDIKQTVGDGVTAGSGALISGVEATQVEDLIFFLDTSTEILVDHTFVHEVGHGVGIANFTPVPLSGCVPGVAGNICFGGNHIVRNNVFRNVGQDRNDLSMVNICGTDQTERQNATEALNPTVRVYNNEFIGVGWAGVLIGGGTTNCGHQTTNPDWIEIENNSFSGTNPSTDANCVANGCRDVVIMAVCSPGAACTHGITFANNIYDHPSDEVVVLSPSVSAATNVSLDYGLYGNATTCPTACGGVSCDGTNMLIRDAATLPNIGSTGVPSAGTCMTLATFKTTHAGQGWEAHSVVGNPAYTNPATDLSITVGSPAINVGQTLTFFTTDIAGTIRPAGAWDIGAFEFSAQNYLGFQGPSTVGIVF